MKKNYCVYWLRDGNQTDVLSQGYVGVTCRVDARTREHEKNFGRKVEVTILASHLTKQEAFTFEYMLRPLPNIGDNKKMGGSYGDAVKSKYIFDLYREIAGEVFYCPTSSAAVLLQWRNNLPKSACQLRSILGSLSANFTSVEFALSEGRARFGGWLHSSLDTNEAEDCHDAFWGLIEGAKLIGGRVEFDNAAIKQSEAEIKGFASKYGWLKAVRIALIALITAVRAEYENRGQGRIRELPSILPEAAGLLWIN